MPNPEETPAPLLSIEESVLRLKTEILSVDWRISEKRADMLEMAFSCLKKRFKNRKSVFAIIVMASNVLAYIRQKGESRVPATVDFLKEAMAHIVTFYEDPRLDPENDKKIFKSIHRRFAQLKEKIQNEHQQDKKPGFEEIPLPNDRSSEQILREAAAQSLYLQKPKSPGPTNDEQRRPIKQASFTDMASAEHRKTDQKNVETLVRELKDSLRKAEELGTTIRQLLVELLSKQQMTLPAMDAFLQRTMDVRTNDLPEEVEIPAALSAKSLPNSSRVFEDELPNPSRTPCDKTELILVQIGEQQVAIEARYVAARRIIEEHKRAGYLKNSTVSLKDFSRFLKSLAGQFSGCLAAMKNGKLRKLSLPLLTPRGINLLDKPMETAKEMLVLCNGNWCGILLCSPVNPWEANMIAIRRFNDGDLWKMALTEDDREIPLLNSIELLKREGNMVLV